MEQLGLIELGGFEEGKYEQGKIDLYTYNYDIFTKLVHLQKDVALVDYIDSVIFDNKEIELTDNALFFLGDLKYNHLQKMKQGEEFNWEMDELV
ncbi:MAG: hypothetical protein QG564_1836 [Campylobacterota bacterium]|nr:hypothetical protein [Campylobacterota bacterium]